MANLRKLGCIKNLDAIAQFVSLKEKRIIDVGCGDLGFTKQLATIADHVIAIDPDQAQAKLNRAAEVVSNITFIEASGESLPADDATLDGVFFVYSLHHIPSDSYQTVFDEVARVLKPDGFAYIIEPVDCPLNDVMKLFHDEDAERIAADKAIHEIAAPMFRSFESAEYHSVRKFESYEDFVQVFSSRTFNPGYSEADVRDSKVREAFEREGNPDFTFQAPKRVTFLKELK